MNPRQHNPFWQYSLAVYRRPGVEESCLALQDDCAVDVNLLLYAAWLAQRDACLTPEHLEDIEAVSARWRREVVLPLRELRVRLRNYSAAEAIREELKALELEAERRQQDLMCEYHDGASPLAQQPAALEANLKLVARRAGVEGDGGGAVGMLISLLDD